MEINLLYAGLAALFGGFVNAVAGGGTLITFPVLTFIGIPPVVANITNTVALCPGYLSGTLAQKSDLKIFGKNIWLLLIAGVIGGLAGALILISTSEKVFTFLIPYLILLGSLLLAVQPIIKKRFFEKANNNSNYKKNHNLISAIFVTPAAVYGGYFGAGLGVILLAVLGVYIKQPLNKINALKQAVSLCVNIAAATLFLFSDFICWNYTLIMAICAMFGGFFGGFMVKKINPELFRWIVVIAGIVIAVFYFVS